MEDKTFEQARLNKLPEGRVNNTDTFERDLLHALGYDTTQIRPVADEEIVAAIMAAHREQLIRELITARKAGDYEDVDNYLQERIAELRRGA